MLPHQCCEFLIFTAWGDKIDAMKAMSRSLFWLACTVPLMASAGGFGPKVLNGWSYGDVASTTADQLGSYAQWSPNVAVTVSHVPTPQTLFEVKCAEVKFFRSPGHPLAWAIPAVGDRVVAVGSSIVGWGATLKIEPQAVSGHIDQVSVARCEGRSQFLLQSGKTLPGMSGGPVYRISDGKAIGITVGYADASALGLQGSVFVPYNVLQAAWEFAKRESPSLSGL